MPQYMPQQIIYVPTPVTGFRTAPYGSSNRNRGYPDTTLYGPPPVAQQPAAQPPEPILTDIGWGDQGGAGTYPGTLPPAARPIPTSRIRPAETMAQGSREVNHTSRSGFFPPEDWTPEDMPDFPARRTGEFGDFSNFDAFGSDIGLRALRRRSRNIIA